jgi:hypothetical protein
MREIASDQNTITFLSLLIDRHLLGRAGDA